MNLPPRTKPDPADRHDQRPPEPDASLSFDGTTDRAIHIIGWAAAQGIVGASLDSTANRGVSCAVWVRTADGEQPVPPGRHLARAEDGSLGVFACVEPDAALAELRRLCAGVDPFASIAQATPWPSTRET